LAVEFITPLRPEPAASLALALITSSQAPLLVLDDRFAVVSASASFCRAFGIDPTEIEGLGLAAIGKGEWDIPQLHSLLRATIASNAAVEAYEMDLVREGHDTACVVVNAQRLELGADQHPMIAMTVTDVTSARLATKMKEALVQEKQVLLQELQHRVANSLQIIASVLMQSARRVQSEETRTHLYSAHNRVMSIATLQKQLAVSSNDQVGLRTYLKELCASIGASMIDDPDRVSLSATADDSEATANVSVSLGLVVTELVINALKHAFPGRNQSGAITVDYAAQGEGWTLNVEDDGVGIEAGDGQGKPGLGTGIVDALAKQLGATVTISDRAPGTRVSVVRPS
jgi:PAS domain S-box-containing protein